MIYQDWLHGFYLFWALFIYIWGKGWVGLAYFHLVCLGCWSVVLLFIGCVSLWIISIGCNIWVYQRLLGWIHIHCMSFVRIVWIYGLYKVFHIILVFCLFCISFHYLYSCLITSIIQSYSENYQIGLQIITIIIHIQYYYHHYYHH